MSQEKGGVTHMGDPEEAESLGGDQRRWLQDGLLRGTAGLSGLRPTEEPGPGEGPT